MGIFHIVGRVKLLFTFLIGYKGELGSIVFAVDMDTATADRTFRIGVEAL